MTIVPASGTQTPPWVIGIGPAPATGRLLDRAGLSIGDIDLVEQNDAFAPQALLCCGCSVCPTALQRSTRTVARSRSGIQSGPAARGWP
jgi:hypothetical protein